ncbi:MAG: hypothetical protein P8M04_02685 [Akkermansiaceae bacterium]|nr:hypothetical protein [Akkermansiaceae bacterium]
MKPFLTLLLESYRGLKSETIFWVTVGLSLLVAVLFLSIGFDENEISFFFGATNIEFDFSGRGGRLVQEIGYIMIFTNLIAGGWLTFIAIILALISCASIFPDAMKEGSAGMLMTKAPSRLQVFLAKLTGSLFFVFIQVGLFVVIVFVAFRWRLGVWNFSVFWYVPAVLLVFLNLYSFMVLLGVLTRSVMTSIMLTMLLWGISAGVDWAITYHESAYQLSQYVDAPTGEIVPEEEVEFRMPEMEKVEGDPQILSQIGTLKIVHSFFPKNSPIMESAEKKLVLDGMAGMLASDGGDVSQKLEDEGELDDAMGKLTANDSTFYSIGTSCIFAFVMLSIAGWLFCRKDL